MGRPGRDSILFNVAITQTHQRQKSRPSLPTTQLIERRHLLPSQPKADGIQTHLRLLRRIGTDGGTVTSGLVSSQFRRAQTAASRLLMVPSASPCNHAPVPRRSMSISTAIRRARHSWNRETGLPCQAIPGVLQSKWRGFLTCGSVYFADLVSRSC